MNIERSVHGPSGHSKGEKSTISVYELSAVTSASLPAIHLGLARGHVRSGVDHPRNSASLLASTYSSFSSVQRNRYDSEPGTCIHQLDVLRAVRQKKGETVSGFETMRGEGGCYTPNTCFQLGEGQADSPGSKRGPRRIVSGSPAERMEIDHLFSRILTRSTSIKTLIVVDRQLHFICFEAVFPCRSLWPPSRLEQLSRLSPSWRAILGASHRARARVLRSSGRWHPSVRRP